METPDDDVIVDVIKSPSPEPPASPQAHPSVIISTPEVLEVPEPVCATLIYLYFPFMGNFEFSSALRLR